MIHPNKLRTVAALAILGMIATAAPAATIYVSTTGNGSTGDSWTNAYTNVTAALAATAVTQEDDEIWIATGTYAEAAPLLPTTNTAIYGGFVGNEPSGYDKSLRAVFATPTTITVSVLPNRVIDMSGAAANYLFDGIVVAGG